MAGNVLNDSGADRKYFILVPHYVWARCEDVYQFTLWCVVKMIAGEKSECYLSTPDLAAAAMMSTGKVSTARARLIELNLLEGERRKDPGYSVPVWHLRIPDLWPLNLEWRTVHQEMGARLEYNKARTAELQARRRVARERNAAAIEAAGESQKRCPVCNIPIAKDSTACRLHWRAVKRAQEEATNGDCPPEIYHQMKGLDLSSDDRPPISDETKKNQEEQPPGGGGYEQRQRKLSLLASIGLHGHQAQQWARRRPVEQIAGWVEYIQNPDNNVKNPPGFMVSKLRADKWAPVLGNKPDEDDGWICPDEECKGYRNKSYHQNCQICGKPRPREQGDGR